MPPIVTSAEIDRPAAEVFAVAIDPARFSQWQKGVTGGHMDGPGGGTQPPSVGARCVTTRRIGGAERPSTSEVVHVNPPKAWGVRGIDGPIRAAVDVTVEPVTDSRARLTISVDFTGHGIGKILVPLMVRREARREMPENIEALKRLIEKGLARPVPPPAAGSRRTGVRGWTWFQ
jgi:Polyketide cyclase / dehydrase and lipid transport